MPEVGTWGLRAFCGFAGFWRELLFEGLLGMMQACNGIVIEVFDSGLLLPRKGNDRGFEGVVSILQAAYAIVVRRISSREYFAAELRTVQVQPLSPRQDALTMMRRMMTAMKETLIIKSIIF